MTGATEAATAAGIRRPDLRIPRLRWISIGRLRRPARL